jgi:hypothetical protein
MQSVYRWEDLETLDVGGSNYREVPIIQRYHETDIQSLSSRHYRRVDGSERQITIAPHELGNAKPVRGADGLDREGTRGNVFKEPQLGLRSEARRHEVDYFCNDEHWHHKRPRERLQKLRTDVVASVVCIDGGE